MNFCVICSINFMWSINFIIRPVMNTDCDLTDKK